MIKFACNFCFQSTCQIESCLTTWCELYYSRAVKVDRQTVIRLSLIELSFTSLFLRTPFSLFIATAFESSIQDDLIAFKFCPLKYFCSVLALNSERQLNRLNKLASIVIEFELIAFEFKLIVVTFIPFKKLSLIAKSDSLKLNLT